MTYGIDTNLSLVFDPLKAPVDLITPDKHSLLHSYHFSNIVNLSNQILGKMLWAVGMCFRIQRVTLSVFAFTIIIINSRIDILRTVLRVQIPHTQVNYLFYHSTERCVLTTWRVVR